MDKLQPLKNNTKKGSFFLSHYFFILYFIIIFFAVIIFFIYKYSYVLDKKTGTILLKQENYVNTCLTENNDCLRRAIDGVYVKPGKENLYPTAIMIENHIDSRPPAGLANANLVYESETEAGITRYLAIFASDQELKKIGPIRSARPYFIDWALELSALYVHCGGSPEALAKITKENVLDLNEFYQSDYFWRDKSKIAPHNIYTSTLNLKEYLKEKELKKGVFFSWKYKNDLAANLRPIVSEISISSNNPEYLVQWKYNSGKNNYLRYLADKIHYDESGQEIRAKNIVIEFVKQEVIDDELRLKMSNLGSGKAVICLDGKCINGSWIKPDSISRSRFYDNQSREIEFNASTTWIEIVKENQEVIY